MVKIVKIKAEEFLSRYKEACAALKRLVEESDLDLDEEWLHEFHFYRLEPDDGTVISTLKSGFGPRELDMVWSGVRWFSSEDAEGDEVELGRRLNSIAPGGLGGW